MGKGMAAVAAFAAVGVASDVCAVEALSQFRVELPKVPRSYM